jgi:hypothetical protein
MLNVTTRTYKVKSNKYADLRWTGGDTLRSNVDIYRNDAFIVTTTANDGDSTPTKSPKPRQPPPIRCAKAEPQPVQTKYRPTGNRRGDGQSGAVDCIRASRGMPSTASLPTGSMLSSGGTLFRSWSAIISSRRKTRTWSGEHKRFAGRKIMAHSVTFSSLFRNIKIQQDRTAPWRAL